MALIHGIAALAAAILLELLAGNGALLIPFTVCVLYRVTLKFPPAAVFFAGFFAGLFFDMLYWRSFPVTAIVYGSAVWMVRMICDRKREKHPLQSASAAGILLGLFSIIPLAALHRFYLGMPGVSAASIIGGIIAALILELLISPRKVSKKEPERQVPEKEKVPKRTLKKSNAGSKR